MRIKKYLLTVIVLMFCFWGHKMKAQNLTVAGDGLIGGNIGIGTQNPAAMLHVRAGANDTDKLLNFAENDNLSFFFEAGFAGVGVTGNTLKLNTFGDNFTLNAMTWRGDGNVGIGVLNPNAKLEVNGNVKINGRIDINNGATNIFIGQGVALNSSPQETVAIGVDAGAMLNQSASLNTFVGKDAGRIATTALQNAVFGGNAAEALTTEDFGTYIGAFAGSVGAADDAVLVGYDANPAAKVTNVTAVGSHAVTNADHQVVLGNVAQSDVRAYTNLSSASDGRFKKNVRENVEGLDFIMDLRPVTYQFDARKLDDFLRAGMKKDPQVEMATYYQALQEKAKITYTGFIAQEVEEAARQTGFDFSGLVKPAHNRDHYGLRYAEFVVPLVKGVQEQQGQIETQEEEISDLKRQLERKEHENRDLERRLARVEALLDKLLDASEENTGAVIPISDAQLLQNQPNPFTQTTTIKYFIPAGTVRAELRVTDVAGRVLKNVIVDTRGEGQTTLDATTLSSGAYQYSLFLDGQLLESKQMVLMD